MVIEPFGAHVEGGRLFGRGACDVKASVAAMVVAFERLVRERPRGSAGVILAFTVDEEFTHLGSTALASMGLPVDLAIVAEPTGFDLVTCHKGAVRWGIVTTGRACHSSTPQLGLNAIYLMARVVRGLEDLHGVLAAGRRDEMLGAASLSVGRIEGGRGVNVVPDRCRIEIDRRLLPGETADGAIEHVRGYLSDQLGDLKGVLFEPPWVEMPALAARVGANDVGRLRDVISRVRGRAPDVIGVPFGTDGGPLGQGGIASVVVGPGDIAQAHTKDEWVDLDQVEAAVEVYFGAAVALGD
jgi:acetylornithine deacetylase